MTQPNSASSETSSASPSIFDKLMFLLIFGTFWLSVTIMAEQIAAWVNLIQHPDKLNSALIYGVWGFIYLISPRIKGSPFISLMFALITASVLMLNYDSWGFHMLQTAGFMYWADSVTMGNLMPWSRSCRMLFQ